MKVILECDGTKNRFQDIFTSMDDNFDINDSIFYAMDYDPDIVNIHHTEYGDIKITIEKEKSIW